MGVRPRGGAPCWCQHSRRYLRVRVVAILVLKEATDVIVRRVVRELALVIIIILPW